MLTVDTTEDPKTVAAPVEPFTPAQQKFFDEIVACYPDEPPYVAIAEASKVVAEKWRDAVVGELDANTTQHGNGPAPASD